MLQLIGAARAVFQISHSLCGLGLKLRLLLLGLPAALFQRSDVGLVLFLRIGQRIRNGLFDLRRVCRLHGDLDRAVFEFCDFRGLCIGAFPERCRLFFFRIEGGGDVGQLQRRALAGRALSLQLLPRLIAFPNGLSQLAGGKILRIDRFGELLALFGGYREQL